MSRQDSLIIKDTHRGLLYEDGVFQQVLPAGRYQIPRGPSKLASFFGARTPRVEVVLVDMRGRDRTVVVQDQLTADGVTVSASFVVQFRVKNPVAASHEVKSFEERLYAEAQTAGRRFLRGMSLEEVLIARDEISEELLRQIREGAATYGVEVTGLDFKDLIVPEKIQRMMNQSAVSRRLRQAEIDADDDTDLDAIDDDDDLVFAHARFDSGHTVAATSDEGPEKLVIRPHSMVDGRNGSQTPTDFGFRRRQSS